MSPKFSAKCSELGAYAVMAAGGVLLIAVVSKLTPLSWQMVLAIVLVTLTVTMAVIHRRKLATLLPTRTHKSSEASQHIVQLPHRPDVDDTPSTQPIPVVSKASAASTSEWTSEKLSPLDRQVTLDNQGQQILFTSEVETQKVGSFGRRAKQYRRVVHSILLDSSDLVDADAATRSNYIPTSDETKVYYFHRLSWWRFGLQKLGLSLLMMLSVIGAIIGLMQDFLTINQALLLSAIGLILGAIGFWFIWIDWNHRYLILTDRRLILAYHPPYGLEGKMQPIDLSTILNNNAEDSLFSNWFLKNSPNKYGSIKADTAAHQDAWLNDIQFVRRHEPLHRLIDELKRSGTTEDSRRIEVAEQTNVLLQGIKHMLSSNHRSTGS